MLNNKQGFTIIEVIVVTALIVIITTISWSALRGMKNRVDVNNACGQVEAMINKTRNYAISGKVIDGSIPKAYSISETGSVVSISDENGIVLESFTLPGGVQCGCIGICAGPWLFTYTAPDGTSNYPNETKSMACLSPNGPASRIVRVTPYEAFCE